MVNGETQKMNLATRSSSLENRNSKPVTPNLIKKASLLLGKSKLTLEQNQACFLGIASLVFGCYYSFFLKVAVERALLMRFPGR